MVPSAQGSSLPCPNAWETDSWLVFKTSRARPTGTKIAFEKSQWGWVLLPRAHLQGQCNWWALMKGMHSHTWEKGDTDNYICKWHFVRRTKDKILQQQQEERLRIHNGIILWLLNGNDRGQRIKQCEIWKTVPYSKFSTQISYFKVRILDQSEFFKRNKNKSWKW